jgi:septal ring factor EnvC (AmiA/AmiB activator)
MRWLVWLMAAVCLLAVPAAAEDKPNPDQLKKAYDDALAQLKAAQDSKNDLAKENERLSKQVEDLKKQLAAGQGRIENLQREVSDNDRKTFSLRAYQAAWQSFLKAHPETMIRWKAFLAGDVLALPQEEPPLFEFRFPEPEEEPTSQGPAQLKSGGQG